MKKRRFVLLDRDGTIIVDKNHLTNPDEVELIPNAVDALKKLRDLGLGIIIVTNQSVIGRGYIGLSNLEAIHKKLLNLLSAGEVVIDDIYFCPHTPEDNCACRKPKLGLIERAAKEHNFDPKKCFVIGDKAIDVKLGQKMGATTFLVRTGYGAEIEKENLVKPDFIVDDLFQTAITIEEILSDTSLHMV